MIVFVAAITTGNDVEDFNAGGENEKKKSVCKFALACARKMNLWVDFDHQHACV